MKTIKVTVDNANGSSEFVVVMPASAEFSALGPGSYVVSQVVKEVVQLGERTLMAEKTCALSGGRIFGP